MSNNQIPGPGLTMDASGTGEEQLAGSSAFPDDSLALHSESRERLSYKFQRLREKLRAAIASGELSGRLPGERKLARKFRVNAKTLSKALTDLAAEGLLDRSIGRGTFVKGTDASSMSPTAEKWLIICEPQQANSAVVQRLLSANPEAQCVTGMPPQRPSFLNSFKAAVIFSGDATEAFIRDLVVRNVAVVVAGREPSTYSTHAVLIDRSHGAAMVARDLMLAGHRRIAVMEAPGSTELTSAIRQTARRYAPDAAIEAICDGEVPAAIRQETTAVICDSSDAADRVRKSLEELQLEVPRHVSLAIIGSGDAECQCSGYVVSSEQFSQAIIEILRDNTAKRPVTLLLSGQSIDCGTIGPTESMIYSSTQMGYTGASA
jgi:DNA-binding transcriptional regulator YhcF (GntR family)